MGSIGKELVWLLPAAAVFAAALLLVRFLAPRMWAVARHTMAEAIRMKIAVFFIVLMALGFWAATQSEGDGTLTGRVQSFLAYTLTAVSILLGLLSIFLAKSLSDEMTDRQILVAMTKPVPRWQFLFGKWLGIVMLNGILLGVMGLGIYLTVTLYLARQPSLNAYDRSRLQQQVLVARHGSNFKIPRDRFKREVDQIYEQNVAAGAYVEQGGVDEGEEKERIVQFVEDRWRVVPLGDYRNFLFDNVYCDRTPVRFFGLTDVEGPIATLDSGILSSELIERLQKSGMKGLDEADVLVEEPGSAWTIIASGSWYPVKYVDGRLDFFRQPVVQLRYKAKANRTPPGEILTSVWIFGDPSKGVATYQTPRRDVAGRIHTISVPADAVAKDGTLLVQFRNIDPFTPLQFNKMFIFEGDDAVQALFTVGGFGGNLIRLLLLTLFKLMFLAAVALLFASVFSFPVATLCSITVYVLAATRGFIADAFMMMRREPGTTGVFVAVMNWMLKALYAVVPNFSRYNAVETLVDGRNVGLAWVLHGAGLLVVVGTTLALLLGWVLFHRREVAEVSV